MYGAGEIKRTLSITKYIATASENLSTAIGNIGLILTYMYTENLVKFEHVVSEICKQFAMFVFSNSGLNPYYFRVLE